MFYKNGRTEKKGRGSWERMEELKELDTGGVVG